MNINKDIILSLETNNTAAKVHSLQLTHYKKKLVQNEFITHIFEHGISQIFLKVNTKI